MSRPVAAIAGSPLFSLPGHTSTPASKKTFTVSWREWSRVGGIAPMKYPSSDCQAQEALNALPQDSLRSRLPICAAYCRRWSALRCKFRAQGGNDQWDSGTNWFRTYACAEAKLSALCWGYGYNPRLEENGFSRAGLGRARLRRALSARLALGIAHRRARWRTGFSYLDRFVPSLTSQSGRPRYSLKWSGELWR